MNAWKVIQDLISTSDLLDRSIDYNKGKAVLYSSAMKDVCNTIRDSEKYHLGEVEAVSTSFGSMFDRWKKRNKRELMPFVDLHTFCKLKQPIMWFEGDFNTGWIGPRDGVIFKFGVLVRYVNFSEDILLVNLFEYVDKGWLMDPSMIYISLGKYMADVEQLKHLKDFFKRSDGSMCNTQWQYAPLLDDPTVTCAESMKIVNDKINFLYVSLLTLNCRNVGTITHAPSKKKIGKRMSASNKAKFNYKTLVLRENSGTTKYEDNLKNKGSRHIRPLQFVDGYPRVYTPERPLFGIKDDPRFYGLMWVKPHTKGDIKQGMSIHKNHKVIVKNKKKKRR